MRPPLLQLQRRCSWRLPPSRPRRHRWAIPWITDMRYSLDCVSSFCMQHHFHCLIHFFAGYSFRSGQGGAYRARQTASFPLRLDCSGAHRASRRRDCQVTLVVTEQSIWSGSNYRFMTNKNGPAVSASLTIVYSGADRASRHARASRPDCVHASERQGMVVFLIKLSHHEMRGIH